VEDMYRKGGAEMGYFELLQVDDLLASDPEMSRFYLLKEPGRVA